MNFPQFQDFAGQILPIVVEVFAQHILGDQKSSATFWEIWVPADAVSSKKGVFLKVMVSLKSSNS